MNMGLLYLWSKRSIPTYAWRGFHWFIIAYDIYHEPALASRAVLDVESECDVDMAELEEMWGEVMFD